MLRSEYRDFFIEFDDSELELSIDVEPDPYKDPKWFFETILLAPNTSDAEALTIAKAWIDRQYAIDFGE